MNIDNITSINNIIINRKFVDTPFNPFIVIIIFSFININVT